MVQRGKRLAVELKQAFTTHDEGRSHQVERLQKVFEMIGKPAQAKTGEAMQGRMDVSPVDASAVAVAGNAWELAA